MLTTVTALAIAIGIAGTLLPFVPGIGLVWASVLVYSIVTGFSIGTWMVLLTVTTLGAVGVYLGFRTPQKAASGYGLGWRAQVFAAVCAGVGFVFIPVVGAPIGFVVGVYVTMLAKSRDHALKATWGTVKALVIASGLQFIAAIAMGLTWVAGVLVHSAA